MLRFYLTAMVSLTLLGVVAQAEDTAGPAPAMMVSVSDHPSIQAAIDSLPTSGGIVQIPPGIFELSEPLKIRTSDTLIRGSGAATHLKNNNADGLPAIEIAAATYDGKKTPKDDVLWRVQIVDLQVTGNPNSGDGLLAREVNEIFIHSVTVSRNGRHGIFLDRCYEDPRISDNLITYNKADGIRLEGNHDIVVSANHFEENQTGLQCLDSFNLCMNGNNLDDHLGDGVIIENTYGSVLSGNMIEECNGWGIIIDRDCYGITISANVIAHEFTGGIDLRDAHGCAISANTFTLAKNAGLAIRKGSGRVTVTGNNFCNSYTGDKNRRDSVSTKHEPEPDAAAGLLIETDEPIVVVGNMFSGMDGDPIVGSDKIIQAQLQTNLGMSKTK
ncbi:Pectate lyase superfamily protein [Rubripirellula lacrimiformis]|uniref:Pectate lyase superfamily protein n=1 Tax=Rubripirellula lacrimiformis TaxID=1930273 RepID=A0A517N4Y4_9BACT|nr:right-handed parallel beta-helix repeat-containing protein [Rubripirellula lacrimiformis]QDT02078.1 Pectate lyase superfamily protein [Rubripirellula lacrimiformis]